MLEFCIATDHCSNLDGTSKNVQIHRREGFKDYCPRLDWETRVALRLLGDNTLEMLNTDVPRRVVSRLSPPEVWSVRSIENEPVPHLVCGVTAQPVDLGCKTAVQAFDSPFAAR